MAKNGKDSTLMNLLLFYLLHSTLHTKQTNDAWYICLWCFLLKGKLKSKADNDDQYDHQQLEIDKDDSDGCEMLLVHQ